MLDGTRSGEENLGFQYDRVEVQLVSLHHATALLEQEEAPDSVKAD
jgi:hypothetical protein